MSLTVAGLFDDTMLEIGLKTWFFLNQVEAGGKGRVNMNTTRILKHAYGSLPDEGIVDWVEALRDHGVETFESCEGGPGHALPEPTIAFHGPPEEGFRALSVALKLGLPVRDLRRYWSVVEGEPQGPWWQLTFAHKCGGGAS